MSVKSEVRAQALTRNLSSFADWNSPEALVAGESLIAATIRGAVRDAIELAAQQVEHAGPPCRRPKRCESCDNARAIRMLRDDDL